MSGSHLLPLPTEACLPKQGRPHSANTFRRDPPHFRSHLLELGARLNEPHKGLGVDERRHLLHLQVVVEAPGTELASQAALLHAAPETNPQPRHPSGTAIPKKPPF